MLPIMLLSLKKKKKKTQGEDGHLQAKEGGLRGNHPSLQNRETNFC